MSPRDVDRLAMSLPEATQEESFGPGVQVYKVVGKVFAIMQPDEPQVTLKCEPGLALELRAQYPSVTAGYHVNKEHWNTVLLDGSVPGPEVEDMVRHAYDRVVAGLPKAHRDRLMAARDRA